MRDGDTTATTTEVPTRRDVIKGGIALGGAGLLAGCAGETPAGSPTGTPTETGTGSATPTEAAPPEVCMEPTGCVPAEPPERVAVFGQTEADMLYALGELDRAVFSASIAPEDYYTACYDDLDIPFDTSGMLPPAEEGYDKELFYEADADLHLMDPTALQHINDPKNFDAADVEEIRENVGPFLGNYGRRPRSWRPYRFYDLYEHFERYGRLFERTERARAIRSVYEETLARVEERRPPERERPSMAVFAVLNDTVYYTDPTQEGYEAKQYRDLGVDDAFAGTHATDNWLTTTDYEGLLETDPDVLVQMNALAFFPTEAAFREHVVAPLRDHEVASELTAVENDRVYPGGVFVQGPVSYLFQLEMLAKQLHPEQFGEWPGVGEPIPESEQLFDRQRVADIVNGDE